MSIRRSLTGVAVAILAAGCGERRPVATSASHGSMPTAPPPLPASLIRLARAGGVARAYSGATLDLLPWQSTDKVPAVRAMVGADLDQRNVYVVDGGRGLLSVELGSRRVRPIAGGILEAAVGPDGSIFAVDTLRGVQLLARRGVTRFHTPLPRATRSLTASPGNSLIAVLTGVPDLVTLTDAGPLATTHIVAGAIATTMYGDLLAVAADSGVVLYDPAARRSPRFWPLRGHVRAVVFSPSGHRLYAGRESGGVAVLDRFTGETLSEIELPGSVAALRTDMVGRWLLAQPVGRDSVWVVNLGQNTMVGAIATSWEADLPAVTAATTVTVRFAGDVVSVNVGGDRLAESGRATGGATDIWLPIAWSPPAMTASKESTTVATATDTVGHVATADTGAAGSAAAVGSAPAPAGQAIYLQVSSSRNPEWAASLVERLKDASLPARSLSPATPDDPYRVVLGPYPTRDAADAASRTIGMPSFVILGPSDAPAPARPTTRP